MSEIPAPEAAATAVTDEPADQYVKPEDTASMGLTAEVEKWKSLSRKNEARAKENAEKALKFDEIQEAAKSDQEKLNDQLAAAQSALADRDAEIARIRAVQQYGLKDADLEILSLVPAEKVEEVAKTLGERAQQSRTSALHRALSGTPVPISDEENLSVNDLIRAARK